MIPREWLSEPGWVCDRYSANTRYSYAVKCLRPRSCRTPAPCGSRVPSFGPDGMCVRLRTMTVRSNRRDVPPLLHVSFVASQPAAPCTATSSRG